MFLEGSFIEMNLYYYYLNSELCISKIGENLFEGKYSPKWIDGKKRQFNVYASTREECEEKLAKMIARTKDELEKLKKATPPKPQKEIKILLY